MTLLLALSVLRVQLRGPAAASPPAAAAFEHAWTKTPPVSLDALFGSTRFALGVGQHALWFSFELHPQVLEHAHDDETLKHAVTVELSEALRHSIVRVSPDIAHELRTHLDLHGLAARVSASAMQCGAKVAEPRVVRVLSDEVMRQALARIGVL